MRSLFMFVAGFLIVMAPGVARAESVPKFVDGAWVLPAREASSSPASTSGPTTQSYSSGSYEDMIYATCAVQGCDPNYLISVMYCEDPTLDPNIAVYNPSSGNMTRGLFQIDDMWGVSTDPQAQINFAADHLGKDVWWACG